MQLVSRTHQAEVEPSGAGLRIKSTQQGTNASLVLSPAVDPTKSVITWQTITTSVTATLATLGVTLQLQADGAALIKSSEANTSFAWQVKEYENVNSLQTGLTTVNTPAGVTVNITPVQKERALIFYNHAKITANASGGLLGMYQGYPTENYVDGKLTGFTFKTLNTSVAGVISWTVLEL